MSALPPTSPARFLSAPEVAALLSCPLQTVWHLCRTNKIAATKIGRSWKIPARALADIEARAFAQLDVAE